MDENKRERRNKLQDRVVPVLSEVPRHEHV
jgi:hypothetical protein